jgi:DNA-binding PadR family transcriptional regulator
MKKDVGQFLPLSPAILHILIALANEDRHGYGIMQEVARQTNDQYKLGPGTLYDNLQKLLDQGLVEEANRRDNDDPRRRYYRLTSLGAEVVSADIQRLESIFRKVKTHLHSIKPRRA